MKNAFITEAETVNAGTKFIVRDITSNNKWESTPFLSICASLPFLSQLDFLSVLSHLLFDVMSLTINFVPAFTVSASG